MLPARVVERHFFQLNQERMDILLELRSLVAAVVPDAQEKLHPVWISYYLRQGPSGKKVCFCIIHIDSDCLRLAFIRGSFLADPKGLLQGGNAYKRYVHIDSYDQAPWDDLRELIQASAAFNPYEHRPVSPPQPPGGELAD